FRSPVSVHCSHTYSRASAFFFAMISVLFRARSREGRLPSQKTARWALPTGPGQSYASASGLERPPEPSGPVSGHPLLEDLDHRPRADRPPALADGETKPGLH